MTRLRGRAARGERVVAAVPQGHWQVTTLLGALRCDGVAAAMTVDAPTDRDVFLTFVEHCLAPTLKPGDVVAMDNLAAHKGVQVQRLINAAGAQVRYLPPYSPDLNPIEPCWSKVKEHLRSAAARTRPALDQAITTAFGAVTPTDARGWFGNCGYVLH